MPDVAAPDNKMDSGALAKTYATFFFERDRRSSIMLRQGHYMQIGMCGRFFQILLAVTALCIIAVANLGSRVAAASQALDASQLVNLLAGSADGTTVVFRGGVDRLFFSPSMKNELRRSTELGLDFLRKQVRPDTVSEGTFIGSITRTARTETLTGVAGIVSDRATGGGVLFLLQTFPDDKTLKAFNTKDRLYSVLIVVEQDGVLKCKSSRWEKLSAFKEQLEFAVETCEFLVGNYVPLGANP